MTGPRICSSAAVLASNDGVGNARLFESDKCTRPGGDYVMNWRRCCGTGAVGGICGPVRPLTSLSRCSHPTGNDWLFDSDGCSDALISRPAVSKQRNLRQNWSRVSAAAQKESERRNPGGRRWGRTEQVKAIAEQPRPPPTSRVRRHRSAVPTTYLNVLEREVAALECGRSRYSPDFGACCVLLLGLWLRGQGPGQRVALARPLSSLVWSGGGGEGV
jgi:hypothetical protein